MQRRDLYIMKKLTVILFVLVLGISSQILAQSKYQHPPSPLYGSLLNAISIKEDGRLYFKRSVFVFLPKTEGTMRVLKDGNEIGKYRWEGRVNGDPFYQVSHIYPEDPRGMQLKSGGNYEFVYEIDGKPFHKFPFKVVSKNSGSAYKMNKEWKLEGPWEDYAYLLMNDKESGKMEIKLWLRNPTKDYKNAKGYVRIVSDATGKVVGTGGGKQFVVPLYQEWRRSEFDIRRPGKLNVKGEYFDNQPLRANSGLFPDGSYTVNVYLDEQLHRKYKFTINGGKIKEQGRQVRESTDHVNFVEGGGDAFWLENIK